MTVSHKRSVFIKKPNWTEQAWSIGMVCIIAALLACFFLEAHGVDAPFVCSAEPTSPVVTASHTAVSPANTKYVGLDIDGLRFEMHELKRVEDTQPSAPISTPIHKNPYVAITPTDEEYILLAGTAYNEARGEPYEGQVAVIEVVLNRYLHPDFKGSIKEIVTAPNQFAYGYKYTDMQMQAVKDALAGYGALDFNINVVWFSTGDLTYGSLYKTICCHEFRAIDTTH